jgi:Flp pilus assembly protein TadG
MNLKRTINNERGQTMTEFAFVLPILVVMLFGIIQFGIIFKNYVTLTDAARAASRVGAVSRNLTPAAATTSCQDAGHRAGSNLTPAKDFVLKCSSTWTIGSDVTVTATFPYHVKLLNWVVADGLLNTTMKERVE